MEGKERIKGDTKGEKEREMGKVQGRKRDIERGGERKEIGNVEEKGIEKYRKMLLVMLLKMT